MGCVFACEYSRKGRDKEEVNRNDAGAHVFGEEGVSDDMAIIVLVSP